ncbi:MAG: LysR substrate-binding domain-containing protein [Burkholderiaceae bacterium]
MNMRVDDLQNFVAIAENGSLTRAAHELGISQPTLSKSLARLERELRTSLITRRGRGIQLTPAGEAAVAYLRNAVLDVRDAMAALRDLRQGHVGTVRIGVGMGIPHALVSTVCSSLIASGDISIELLGGMSDSLAEAVVTGDADFAITGVRPMKAQRLEWTPLFHDPLIPIAQRSHPLVDAQKVSWRRLAQERWIVTNVGTITRQWFDHQFRVRGLATPNRLVSLRGYPFSYEIAAATAALLLVPRTLAWTMQESGFREIPRPRDWHSERVVGMLARSDSYMSSAARNVMASMASSARRMFRESAIEEE